MNISQILTKDTHPRCIFPDGGVVTKRFLQQLAANPKLYLAERAFIERLLSQSSINSRELPYLRTLCKKYSTPVGRIG